MASTKPRVRSGSKSSSSPKTPKGKDRSRLRDKSRETDNAVPGKTPVPKKAPRVAGSVARNQPDRCQPATDAIERLIIESLANPQHRHLTIAQRAELLGIGRSTWYRHISEPLFRVRAQAIFRQACENELGPILCALIESAKELGREGHADRKLFLGMMGVYEAGVAAGRFNDDERKKPANVMTDAQLIAHFADRPHMLPPGVQRRLGIVPSETN